MNRHQLEDMLAHHAAVFQKFDQRSGRWQQIDPPKELVEKMLAVGHWGFSDVVGIINTPTLRPDGTIVDRPGYDAATKLWYKPAADVTEPLAIPERPTREDALAALEKLEGLLRGFPFETPVDKAVAVAAGMTTVLRGAIEVAPMFLVRAPEPGTGKSYLINLLSTIATGRIAPAIACSDNEEEMEKRLKPETRNFRGIIPGYPDLTPIELVENNRREYLTAIFTIVRAHIAAGRPIPNNATQIADFAQWSSFVQHPLMWLGLEDPIKSMEDARQNDPERAELFGRISALVQVFGVDNEFSASDVEKQMMSLTTSPEGAVRARYPALVAAFSSTRGKVSASTIGSKLAKDAKRPQGGYRLIIQHDPVTNTKRYNIEGLAPKSKEDEPF